MMHAVEEARQELWKAGQKDQSARPLRIIREDPLHMADDLLKKRFQQLADDELRICKLNVKE